MNYLAHLFLAGKNDGMILGALLEDCVVGGIDNSVNSLLPEDVKKGLRLHRHIDTFTDSDKGIAQVKQLFYTDFGKYSGVIVDVIFDHFLHKNWETFSDEKFEVFKESIYTSLTTQYLDLQPPRLKRLIDSMTEHDWLKTYIHFWGVERALSSLNRRVGTLDLTDAMEVVHNNYEFINGVFLDFFSRLKTSCEHFVYGK